MECLETIRKINTLNYKYWKKHKVNISWLKLIIAYLLGAITITILITFYQMK